MRIVGDFVGGVWGFNLWCVVMVGWKVGGCSCAFVCMVFALSRRPICVYGVRVAGSMGLVGPSVLEKFANMVLRGWVVVVSGDGFRLFCSPA